MVRVMDKWAYIENIITVLSMVGLSLAAAHYDAWGLCVVAGFLVLNINFPVTVDKHQAPERKPRPASERSRGHPEAPGPEQPQ